ncbi:hypothetical protein [Methylobacterium komagatae]
MVHSLLTAVVISAIFVAGHVKASAETPEQRLNKMARSIVRISTIERFCSEFYLVDKVKTDQINRAMLSDAINRFGAAQVKRALDAMDQEIHPKAFREGAAIWCPAQRRHFGKIGINDLIGGPLP